MAWIIVIRGRRMYYIAQFSEWMQLYACADEAPQANKCKLSWPLMDDQARPVEVGLNHSASPSLLNLPLFLSPPLPPIPLPPVTTEQPSPSSFFSLFFSSIFRSRRPTHAGVQLCLPSPE